MSLRRTETAEDSHSETTEGEETASSEDELTDTESGDSTIGVEFPGEETTDTPTDEFGE